MSATSSSLSFNSNHFGGNRYGQLSGPILDVIDTHLISFVMSTHLQGQTSALGFIYTDSDRDLSQ